jgi:hypothetical protein
VPKQLAEPLYSIDQPMLDHGLSWPQWAIGRQLDEKLYKRLQFDFDQRKFSTPGPIAPGGLSRPELFRRMADVIVPGWFIWHEWTMRIVRSLCRYRWCGVLGCSNSSKTYNVASFAAVWWLAAPKISSVIFCSTTMKMLRKRGWANIQQFYQSAGGPGVAPGNFVDSRTVWQVNQGDDKHAIFCKAVGEGDVNKAAADIQGIHTRRQLVIIDEAEAVPAAIWKACANLYSYPVDAGGEFILVAMANPRSRLSQFGRFIEPENGWQSVSVETDEWMSKPQMDGKKAVVMRFDFRKSPNITEGKTLSSHIPTKNRVEQRIKALKARNGENDPDHWCYDLGFPPPEGLSKTVFTESLLEMHKAYDKHRFTGSNFIILGAFDQAFGGGDRPALRFAAMGEIEGGKIGIEVMEPIILYVDATSTDPARYQLMNQLRANCAKVMYRNQPYDCPPEHFAIDCTGDGGLADICQREWSPKIIRILFSSSPSEEPCSHEDERPAKEVYLNKRVEMYFQSRNAVMSGQLKGLDKDTASELCSIEELVEKTDGSIRPKKCLQSKKEYKLKFQKSPDNADSFCMICEVARQKGFHIVATGLTVLVDEGFTEQVEKSLAVYEDVDYSAQDDQLEYVEPL